MAKYKFVDILYNSEEDTLSIREDIETILEEQAMYGYRLAHIIHTDYNMFGPTKTQLIFEKER